MALVLLPVVGQFNPDDIATVRWCGARWRNKTRWRRMRNGKLRSRSPDRPRKSKGKWKRTYGSGILSDTRWYEHAEVRVYLRSDRYPMCYQYPDNTQAKLAYDELSAALKNLRDYGPERIVAAAVRGPRMVINGTTLETDSVMMTFTLPAPARHHNILHYLARFDYHVEQGFLTSTGRFVTRKEAMGIAVAAGQVPASKVTAPDLFSEDLW